MSECWLKGKTVVVTGASGGMGAGIAATLINKLRGTFTCVAVKAPGFGDRRKEMLRDIAILTGGEVISEELGLELKETTMEDVSECHHFKALPSENAFPMVLPSSM